MRLVVSFTIDLDLDVAAAWGAPSAHDAVCALLPEGCEDIVIIAEAERDALRAMVAEDQAWDEDDLRQYGVQTPPREPLS